MSFINSGPYNGRVIENACDQLHIVRNYNYNLFTAKELFAGRLKSTVICIFG